MRAVDLIVGAVVALAVQALLVVSFGVPVALATVAGIAVGALVCLSPRRPAPLRLRAEYRRSRRS